MHIVTKIRLDQKQMPYWSERLVHNGNVVIEVTSKTFNPNNTKEFRELRENVQVRMTKCILQSKDQQTIRHMLIQDDATADAAGNKAQGS